MVVSRAKEIRKKHCGKMNPIHAAQIQVLPQEGKVRSKELLKKFPQYSRLLIYHWAKKPINSKILVEQRKFNKGRPKKLSGYDERWVVRTVKNWREIMVLYTSTRVQLDSGTTHVCNKTVGNYINRNGHYYLHSRKKGLSITNDLKKHRLSIYLDRKGFQYKTNAMNMARAPKAK